MPDGGARQNEAEGMDGISRIGHQHHIARRGNRRRQIGEAFLGAQRRNHLGIGIERHAEAALVIGRHRLAQALDAPRSRIAVRFRIARGFAQFVDDMLGRRHVRVAHAEIDDVVARRARLRLEAVHFLKNVWRQPLDAVEIGLHGRDFQRVRDKITFSGGAASGQFARRVNGFSTVLATPAGLSRKPRQHDASLVSPEGKSRPGGCRPHPSASIRNRRAGCRRPLPPTPCPPERLRE